MSSSATCYVEQVSTAMIFAKITREMKNYVKCGWKIKLVRKYSILCSFRIIRNSPRKLSNLLPLFSGSWDVDSWPQISTVFPNPWTNLRGYKTHTVIFESIHAGEDLKIHLARGVLYVDIMQNLQSTQSPDSYFWGDQPQLCACLAINCFLDNGIQYRADRAFHIAVALPIFQMEPGGSVEAVAKDLAAQCAGPKVSSIQMLESHVEQLTIYRSNFLLGSLLIRIMR